MRTRTARLAEQAYRRLQDLAARSGQSVPTILDKAVEAYRREQFLRDTNAAFAALRADPEAWQDELAERAAWDTTLGDGIPDS